MQSQMELVQGRNKNFIPIVASSVLIVSLVAGVGVYAYQKSVNNRQTADLQSQITMLHQQVSALKNASPTTSPTAQPVIASTPIITPDPTISWKTGKSAIVNLAFKYPAEASYSET